jgi:anthranilate phosphoribosyltransferase
MNAGAGIYAAERTDSIGEGIELAAEAIDSGAALECLNRLVAFTQLQVNARQVIA